MDEKKKFEECLDNLKFTRDFDLYLDMLNTLKDKYLIILCVRGPLDGNAPATTSEKLRSMGFSKYAAKPFKKYVGVSNNGNIICDSLTALSEAPLIFRPEIGNMYICISFENGNLEIKFNRENQSLDEKELNIIVYDCEKSEIVDASCYDVFAEKSAFYHRNFYFSDQYIKSHIYMPEKYMARITPPMKKSYFSKRKLGVKEVENGIVLPLLRDGDKILGGVCDENFNFIAGHQVFNEEQDTLPRHVSGCYSFSTESLEFLDETVVYGGNMSNHPGHLIAENFANRIWWLVKNADSDLKVAVTVEWEYTVWQDDNKRKSEYAFFVKDFFKTLGIPEERIIFVKKALKFKRIIIPDQCLTNYVFINPYEFTPEYRLVFQQMKNRISPAKYKKVYFTKTKAPQKNIVGEEFFIDFYEKRGFKILHPEDYNLMEQAEFLYGADEVVTVDGSVGLFAILCKPSTRVTVLGKMFSYWSIIQQLVNEAAELEFFLVNVSGSIINVFSDKILDATFYSDIVGNALSLVYVTEEFKKYVKDVFNEELDITPEESLRSVLYDYLAYVPKYYSKRMVGFNSIKNIKMKDIIQNISEIFFREDFDTSGLKVITREDQLQNMLILQQEENGKLMEKLKLTADKAKEFIEENARLKQYIAQLETEIERLDSRDNGSGDNNELRMELLAVYRQKDEAKEELLKAYRRMDEITKQLLQVMEEKATLTAYIAGMDQP